MRTMRTTVAALLMTASVASAKEQPTYWYSKDLKTCEKHVGSLASLREKIDKLNKTSCKVQDKVNHVALVCGKDTGAAIFFWKSACQTFIKQEQTKYKAIEQSLSSTMLGCIESYRRKYPGLESLDYGVPFCVCTSLTIIERYGPSDDVIMKVTMEQMLAINNQCHEKVSK